MTNLAAKLKKSLKRIGNKYGIEYAILFGSYTGEYQVDESDVDIAVKLKKTPKSFRKKVQIITGISSEIERIIGKETDIIVLNDSPPGLRFEIFEKGKTLMVWDRQVLVNDKAMTMAEYHDFSIWVKPLYDKLIEDVTHGRK